MEDSYSNIQNSSAISHATEINITRTIVEHQVLDSLTPEKMIFQAPTWHELIH
jgi:hypothetical protein